MLRLQDFKSIGEYNHDVHKICARLYFCEKEPFEIDKIEKTLQTMLPSDRILQHQYRAKNYQTYSDLVHDFLQVEKYNELTLKNHHQRSIGSAPMPEVHHNVKGNEIGDGSNNHHNKFEKLKKDKHNGKNIKNKVKGKGKGKTKAKAKAKVKAKAKAKARYLHAINVVVQTTLLGNVEPLNTWSNCTKDP
jgi:hypothetical protein